MPTPSTIIEIEKEIKSLSPDEQLMLMEKLVRRLRESGLSQKKLDWKNLYGIGKDLWGTEDTQEYVDRLREDRMLRSPKSLPQSIVSSSTQPPSSIT